MTAKDKREQRLKLRDDHIGQTLRESGASGAEGRAELRQQLALRLEKLRTSGTL